MEQGDQQPASSVTRTEQVEIRLVRETSLASA